VLLLLYCKLFTKRKYCLAYNDEVFCVPSSGHREAVLQTLCIECRTLTCRCCNMAGYLWPKDSPSPIFTSIALRVQYKPVLQSYDWLFSVITPHLLAADPHFVHCFWTACSIVYLVSETEVQDCWLPQTSPIVAVACFCVHLILCANRSSFVMDLMVKWEGDCLDAVMLNGSLCSMAQNK
jgi:hypothetical protein